MKRAWVSLSVVLLAACGGSGKLNLSITSEEDDATAHALRHGEGALADAKSIKVTISEISVHLAD